MITNQLGAYCSGTFKSGNTRKYHGLLVAAKDDLKRNVIVSQLEEKVLINDAEYYLSTITYKPGDVVTSGYTNLVTSSIHSQTVCFEYAIGKGVKVFKEVNLAQESNTIIVRYKVITDEKIKFSVAPLITHRENSSINQASLEDYKANRYLNIAKIALGNYDELSVKVLSFNPQKLLNVSYKIDTTSHLYKDIYYSEEALRKYEASENLLNPLVVNFNLDPGESFISLQFSYRNSCDNLPQKLSNALKLVYSLNLNKKEAAKTPLLEFKEYLLNNYHSFLIDSNVRKSVIAGYPWFGDWGRDTFISLPGLALTTGEYDFAKEVINYWGKYIYDGLIPNSLTNKAYNTIDASLWYILSIYRHYVATSDKEYLNEMYSKVKNILVELINGSQFSIQVDGNGFLIWNDPKYNLTWMDSEAAGASTTNRIGACVEIQMLWYNCLKVYEFMQKELRIKDDHEEITGLIKLVFQKFNKYFWNQADDYAYDFIYDDNFDRSIRPNVIIGLSLPFRLFDKKKTDKILSTAYEQLYSELGLMTLNKTDVKYNGFYQGSQQERDKAYHNGVIWPFLLGFYLKAILVNYPNNKDKQNEVKEMLITFWKGIKSKKLNYLPEIFAANDLHPDGCVSQAWNYALFLEVYQLLQ